MSLIKIYNVSKQYDSRLLLRDVYFRLSKGDKVELIGKNDVGKTTLLRLILRQARAVREYHQPVHTIKMGL